MEIFREEVTDMERKGLLPWHNFNLVKDGVRGLGLIETLGDEGRVDCESISTSCAKERVRCRFDIGILKAIYGLHWDVVRHKL